MMTWDRWQRLLKARPQIVVLLPAPMLRRVEREARADLDRQLARLEAYANYTIGFKP